MVLRILIPLVVWLLLLPVIAHWPVFVRYTGRWTQEVLAVLACTALYFVVWFAAHAALRSLTGSEVAAVVLATLLAGLSLPFDLWLGFRIFKVRPDAHAGAH